MSSTIQRFLRRFIDMFSSPLDAVRQTLILGMIGKECKLLLDTTQWTEFSFDVPFLAEQRELPGSAVENVAKPDG